MKKILIMCPSRSADGVRSKHLIRLYDSWINTTTGNSDFLLGIDDNDKHNYPLLNNIILDVNKEQLTVVKKINYLFKKYSSNYKYIYFVGDDCIFRTSGWEDIFLEDAEKHKYCVYYGNDTIQEHRLPTHPFISINLLNQIGFMGPECLVHMFVDNFWMELGKIVNNLKYFPQITLEHLHPANGKAEEDSLYKKNNSFYNKDMDSYINYINNFFIQDMKKIKF